MLPPQKKSEGSETPGVDGGTPCKRCTYNMQVKKKIIKNYHCDVGLRSLLRSIRAFY